MLSIGEFSKLAHLSARMLRHYDSIGLLHPAQIGNENGYRYYEQSPLAIIAKIETLKGFGFTRTQISTLLPPPQSELVRRIRNRKLHVCQDFERGHQSICHMEQAMVQMGASNAINESYPVLVMNDPEQTFLSIRRVIPFDQIHALFAGFRAEMNRRGLKRTEATPLRFLGETFSDEAMDVEAQSVVDTAGPGVSPPSPHVPMRL